MSGLRQIPRVQFDKGQETARKTAIAQAKFITDNLHVLKGIDEKSRPRGWKLKRFEEMVDKLNSNTPLDKIEFSHLDEFYEAVISEVYNVPGYKKEFYKGHIR